MPYVIASRLHRRQRQVLRRGVPGRLHLRGRAQELHQPQGVHRLRRLRAGLPGRGDHPGPPGGDDDEPFVEDNRRFFTEVLPGRDEPLGSPGGARRSARSASTPSSSPRLMTLYALDGFAPVVHPTAWVHPDATVIGRVELGPEVSIWPQAVLRGDYGEIRIGARTSIQDGTVAAHDRAAPDGRRCGLRRRPPGPPRGLPVGDRVLIGSNSVVLNRVVIEDGALVGAGALVAEGTLVPGRPPGARRPRPDRPAPGPRRSSSRPSRCTSRTPAATGTGSPSSADRLTRRKRTVGSAERVPDPDDASSSLRGPARAGRCAASRPANGPAPRRGTMRRVVRGAKPIRAKNRCRSASWPADRGDDVFRADLLGVAGRGREQPDACLAPAVLPVHDERVDGDLRDCRGGTRIQAEDGEPDGHLARPRLLLAALGPGSTARTTRCPGILEQPAEPGSGARSAGVAAEDVLGVRVGAVLTDEREHGGQVGGTRGARDHAGPRTGS